ncbi:MAG: aminopeptidase P family protein [Alphaproteobacteria bacterium]|nr:aminopeptidase P family protein [Alphaproteobacteria bacterium]
MTTICEIRQKMQAKNIDAYIVAHNNRFIGQDISDDENKIKHLCGFSGSAGMLAITKDQAFLLVDGRYELQARKETNATEITVIDALPRLKNVCDILSEQQNIYTVGYDAWNHSVAEMEFIKRRYINFTFQDIDNWLNSNNKNNLSIEKRGVEFSGATAESKIKRICNILNERNADFFLLTSADSVSWLLNIYSRDLPYSPIVRAGILVFKDERFCLIGENLQTDLPVISWSELKNMFSDENNFRILYDPHTLPEKIKNMLKAKLIKAPDYCQQWKAEKNATELQGMINCHIRDGVALSKFLCWLQQNWRGLHETDVVSKLHEFRAAQKYFFSESFATIAGCAKNSAIVHYQPNTESNAELEENNLLLIDSGGQYFDGTTDVTRTVALGTPTQEMKADFTMVLKAHIALAQAVFPEETSGAKLDILAREKLWQNTLDYKHGTGHGVACFGNVHEGPVSISPTASDYGFKTNMITSNEPGVYHAEKYGIRIENLQYTAPIEKKSTYGNFLQFKYLTKVPIDKHLIDEYLLSAGERAWLNKYHHDVYNDLAPYLNENEKVWLKDACSPL